MKPVLAILAIYSLLLLGGCGSPAVSLHPLYMEKEKPATEKGIEGAWLSEDSNASDADRWDVAVEADGCYHASSQQQKTEANKPKQTELHNICLVRLRENLFFDSELLTKDFGTTAVSANDLGISIVRGHIVGRLWLVGNDMLRVARLSSTWVEKNMPENQRTMQGKTAIITASTDDLRRFLSEHTADDSLWDSSAYLCRPGVDCKLRATDDRLVRYPDDDDVLRDAAIVFVTRGDYAKATGLLQHAAQVAPDKAANHALLALTLAAKGDLAGTRRELTQAQQLDKDDPGSYDDFIGTAYYLEGNFQEASRIFARLHAEEKAPSAGLLLMNYFSLARAGRRKEANAYLAKESARFTGSAEDHLMLLEAAGRVTDPPWAKLSDNEGVDVIFMYAENCLAQGDLKSARTALERIVKKTDEDIINRIAAKIELDRLGDKKQ